MKHQLTISNIRTTFKRCNFILALFGFLLLPGIGFGQAELMPWGNLSGIRIKGQLFEIKTALRVTAADGKHSQITEKEHQKPKFNRNGKQETVITNIDSLYFIEKVTDAGKGHIKVHIECTSHSDTVLKGIYFTAQLPVNYTSATITQANGSSTPLAIAEVNKSDKAFTNLKANNFAGANGNQLTIGSTEPYTIIFPKIYDNTSAIRLSFVLKEGNLKKGETVTKDFDLKVAGPIDESIAHLKLDTNIQGRPFVGFGGNFRLQNPKADPGVIDYCLNNMRVAWGRVEMPWRQWQPELNSDPIADANNGKLNPHVRASMEMAQRLGKMNMPVIVTAWFPPAWAAEGELHNQPVNSIWGNPLNKNRLNDMYKSITDYIIYLRDHYGVEASYFSFNESDLGINVRQTGEEHDDLIKHLGAYFSSRGLKTKLLLGDNSDATTYKFIDVAMNDPEARPYIGAVSFHSWRGWDTPTLQKWLDAAKKLNVPLIVGEGSIDAAAYAYPNYFLEQSYALEEINLYMRLLAICQPITILQWQLTSDYSPLVGGGVYNTEGPLKPTQRFWNLKQLASTPLDVHYMPVSVDRSEITCAALGNNSKHTYVIHLVNNGAKRKIILTGLPAAAKRFEVTVTNIKKDMKKILEVKVDGGQATLDLPEESFISLTTK